MINTLLDFNELGKIIEKEENDKSISNDEIWARIGWEINKVFGSETKIEGIKVKTCLGDIIEIPKERSLLAPFTWILINGK